MLKELAKSIRTWMVPRKLVLAFALVTGSSFPSYAITYDPAADFEAGYLAASNPNGVCSYGYSASLTGPVTLYTAQAPGGDSSNQQMWISPGVNCCVASPSVGFNKDQLSITATLPRTPTKCCWCLPSRKI